MAFAPLGPIRSVADLRRLEETPLEQAIPVDSTYALFAESARAFGDKTALTFLRSGDPADDPIRWSYRQLFEGITQAANLFHALGIGPGDTGGGAAARLPGMPPGAVGAARRPASCNRSIRCCLWTNWKNCCTPPTPASPVCWCCASHRMMRWHRPRMTATAISRHWWPTGQRTPNPARRHRRLLPHRRHHRSAQACPAHPRQPGLHNLGQRAVAGYDP